MTAEKRQQLISMLAQSHELTIKEAAKALDINYSTAKHIMKTS